MPEVEGRVVAATDGSAGGRRGVRYAAREARRRGVPLQVVHVSPAYTVGPVPDTVVDSVREHGQDVLMKAVADVHEEVPEVEVTGTLVHGGRVGAIVAEADGAALLVLGSGPATLAERLLAGPTAAGVASRSRCPVLVVPDRGDPEDRHDRVVVGVKDIDRAGNLLARAFATAEDLGAELVVLHCWRLPSGYDDVVADRVGREQWRAQLTHDLEEQLAPLRQRHPTVQVRVDVVHGRAGFALADVSETADLLLISRPLHGGYAHHLGTTARATLRASRCPVEVLPPAVGGSRDATGRARPVAV